MDVSIRAFGCTATGRLALGTLLVVASSRIPTSPTVRPGDPPGDGLPEHYRRIVSFTPRGGRLNPVQKRAFDEHADAWYLEGADLGEQLDPVALFSRDAPLIVEIGSGMGESTAAMAAARPEVNLLAIEVYKPGVAQTFHHLAKAGATNVRVLRADVVPVLEQLVAPDSLDEVWIFFPDPWPKARHHKRRLVTEEFVRLVASRLRPGGRLRLATDWEDYAEQMAEVVAPVVADGVLRNEAASDEGPWAPRFADRPLTKFERRGIAEGRRIFDLELVRPGQP